MNYYKIIADRQFIGIANSFDLRRYQHKNKILLVDGQKINGMTLIVTANAPAGTVIALYKGAVGFGQQINELEAMRLQGAFADGVRGLNVAGAVVLNADGVATLTYTIAEAEA